MFMLSATVLSKILPLHHFFRHTINILSPTSSSPVTVPPKLFPHTSLQHKISFSIHNFHLLLIFLLLIIGSGPTSTVLEGQPHARQNEREREADLHVGTLLGGSAAVIFASCSRHTEGRGWAAACAADSLRVYYHYHDSISFSFLLDSSCQDMGVK
jgi:hypothetical protein